MGLCCGVACARPMIAVTRTQLIAFDTSDPTTVDVIGSHGQQGYPYGLTFHPGDNFLYSIWYQENGPGLDLSLVRIDPRTGQATPVRLLANTAHDEAFESLEYVDSLSGGGGLVVSHGLGHYCGQLSQMDTAGNLVAFLTTVALDNDFSVWDSTLDQFYSIDPNGLAQLVRIDLATGAWTSLGGFPLDPEMHDLAYDPVSGSILATSLDNQLWMIGTNAGAGPISMTSLGTVAGDLILGLSAAPPPCSPADLAPPFLLLDLSDIIAFVTGFLAQDPIADLNADGLLDLKDINLFVVSFLTGCP
jgi:hypothetical protein